QRTRQLANAPRVVRSFRADGTRRPTFDLRPLCLATLAKDSQGRRSKDQGRREAGRFVTIGSVLDVLDRPLRNLRLSVTDRCNLRCQYCMPEADYVWLPKEDLLHFEEISALADIFISLGVDRMRLTGGEPLLRRNLSSLVSMLAAKPGLAD